MFCSGILVRELRAEIKGYKGGVLLCNRLGTQARIGIVILGKQLGLGGDWWSQGTITSLIAIGWLTSSDY